MNEPRVVESVTNECQSLGRAHESSSARAEQLIACLEGEIAKRDVELAACLVAVENCEVFRARIAELESAAESLRLSRDYHHEQEIEYRRRWAGVTTVAHSIVIPERDAVIRKAVGMCNRIPGSTTWNAAEYAYDELVAILYAAPVSEAKAQGVVMPERLKPSRYELHDAAVDAWNTCLDEVARLNAAPVQKVSVPDTWLVEALKENNERVNELHVMTNKCRQLVVALWRLRECLDPGDYMGELSMHAFIDEALSSAQAAPAADAGHVFYGMDGNHP